MQKSTKSWSPPPPATSLCDTSTKGKSLLAAGACPSCRHGKTVSFEYPAHCQNGEKKGSCLSSDPEPASPFSLLGMQQFSAGSVLPPRDRSLLQLLNCLSFIYATTLQASPPPQHALGRVQPPSSCPTMASPSTETPGPVQQRLCQQPSSRTALSMAQGPLGCSSAVTGPQPSLQSGLAGHHTNQQGLLKAFCSQQTHLV